MRKGYTVIVIYPFVTDGTWFNEDYEAATKQFNMHIALATNCTPPVITDTILLIHQEADKGPAEIKKRWTAKDGASEVNIPYND